MTAPFRATHADRRSLANQSVAEVGGRLSVLSRQKLDHMRLDELLQRLRQAPRGEETPILLSIYRLVFTHAFAEEAVLWPVIRRVLPDGHELTLEVEREHQQINELVTALESRPSGLPEGQELDRLIALLSEDVRDEEDVLLPRLQAKLSPNQLRLLGVAWEAVRRIAPTRAHPIVARRPPGNVLAALPLSVLDRSRDRIDALLYREPGWGAPPLRALSSGLGWISHAVEHFPVLQQGEDPDTHIGEARSWPTQVPMLAMLAAGFAALTILAQRRKRGLRVAT